LNLLSVFAKHKVKFGKWLELDEIKRNTIKAVESGAVTEFAKLITAYISTAFSYIPLVKWYLGRLYWEDVMMLFSEIVKAQTPTKIPLFGNPGKEKEIPWEYPNRNTMYLLHLLVGRYGWELEYVRNLSVDTAFSLAQEILTEDQLEKEFVYSLSEVAYPYNATTKKSSFKPLERPYWMLPKPKEIKKVKILKRLMPVGVGVDVSGMEKLLDERYKNKEVKPS